MAKNRRNMFIYGSKGIEEVYERSKGLLAQSKFPTLVIGTMIPDMWLGYPSKLGLGGYGLVVGLTKHQATGAKEGHHMYSLKGTFIMCDKLDILLIMIIYFGHICSWHSFHEGEVISYPALVVPEFYIKLRNSTRLNPLPPPNRHNFTYTSRLSSLTAFELHTISPHSAITYTFEKMLPWWQLREFGLIRHDRKSDHLFKFTKYTGWGLLQTEEPYTGIGLKPAAEIRDGGIPGTITCDNGPGLGYNFHDLDGDFVGVGAVVIWDQRDNEVDVIYGGPPPPNWSSHPNMNYNVWAAQARMLDKSTRRLPVPFSSPHPSVPGLYYDLEGYNKKNEYILLAGASLFSPESHGLADARNDEMTPQNWSVFVTRKSLAILLKCKTHQHPEELWYNSWGEYLYPMLQIAPDGCWTWTPMKPSSWVQDDNLVEWINKYHPPADGYGSDIANAVVNEAFWPTNQQQQHQ
ncbi:hypothetical protein HD806DRAFT_548046 [Xylariaceae sp. AK1471]|nr:hypothetical protein HD806DRAFT_548046 [Xylariaceae sp. AK1471]